ncbi:hypothetical protein A2716_01995 [candidate division WWE3 bacterium RIFCSPHIGHO2_01_FULL_40_23]|uniref:Uncharacterized protein n=1 Tax=candidate division WWE3 bacterium RIFCSPLOWO2_01_FULL_41_18 TaxID=1802625 RepID=A0A1F4VET0_UNCKA|nr:MAG: hypothetical protein A2716_01995 [candidate division WWE3 bacterium RIFCSPHIGHO2_01_FULL_40_23]OGC55762.1 MAG: hypothetical protein A3A78_01845 [candidate division WWE3 bacterium RIFCSPLOWO2_01_FULL_41_18]
MRIQRARNLNDALVRMKEDEGLDAAVCQGENPSTGRTRFTIISRVVDVSHEVREAVGGMGFHSFGSHFDGDFYQVWCELMSINDLMQALRESLVKSPEP